MEFKKCARCGCFFMSDDSVCCNCKPKDKFDTIKLQNYLEEFYFNEENYLNNLEQN